jgi:hypothetical protein
LSITFTIPEFFLRLPQAFYKDKRGARKFMKVSSKIYKGIEYVQLNELPAEQKEKFSESLDQETLIKILIDEKVVSNCIQYKDYEFWFDNIYKKIIQVPVTKIDRMPEPSGVVVALGKV